MTLNLTAMKVPEKRTSLCYSIMCQTIHQREIIELKYKSVNSYASLLGVTIKVTN